MALIRLGGDVELTDEQLYAREWRWTMSWSTEWDELTDAERAQFRSDHPAAALRSADAARRASLGRVKQAMARDEADSRVLHL